VSGTWTSFDATDLATAWLSGRYPNQGILVKSSGDLGTVKFISSNNANAAQWPKIVFNYLLPCGATGPVDVSSATLNASSDSFDDSGAVQANNGAATTLSLYYTPAREKRLLLSFDTSSIPAGVVVSSAILRLYVSGVASATANTKAIWANAMGDAWLEGSGNNTNKNCPTTATAGSSWNYSTGCTGWSYVHPPTTAPAWAAMAPMPTARTNVMAAAVGGKIYAIGGRLISATFLKTVEEYDIASNTWATKASMPTARSDAAVGVVNGLIYVIGGDTGASAATAVNEVYDPASNTWTSKAAMTTGRKYGAAAVVNDQIYVLGGVKSGASYLKTNEMYDPSANTWTSKAQMPTARGYFRAEAANGKVYAIGGYNVSSMTTNEEYDPSANNWSSNTALPVATDSLASAAIGNKIYLIAGMRGSALTNQAWLYDALANAYTALANYPFADDIPAATAVGGYIYVLGGDNVTTTVYANQYRYDPGFPAPVATASDESKGDLPLAAGFNKGWINFELKSLVQEWVDGVRPNNGLVIYTEVGDQFSINSREAASNTPQLVVNFTR